MNNNINHFDSLKDGLYIETIHWPLLIGKSVKWRRTSSNSVFMIPWCISINYCEMEHGINFTASELPLLDCFNKTDALAFINVLRYGKSWLLERWAMYWNIPLTFADNSASKKEKALMGFCLHDSMMQFHQTLWNGAWDQFHCIRAQPAWLWLNKREAFCFPDYIPDSKAHGANMGPTWVLSAPDGPHVSPMNLVIRDVECISWYRQVVFVVFCCIKYPLWLVASLRLGQSYECHRLPKCCWSNRGGHE